MRISLPTLLFQALLGLLIPAATLHAATTPGVNGSVPGFDWTLRTTSPVTDHAWSSVIYGEVSGNPLFVAVGNAGATSNQGVMTSPDGVTWTQRTASAAHSWSAVTYNGSNRFVAVGGITGSGTFDGAMYSADGTLWSTATTPSFAVAYSSVAYGNGNYVAVSSTILGSPNAFKQVMTSPDGATWTSRDSAESHPWQSVAFGNSVFVAVTSTTTTNQVMRSTDNGANWTAVASPITKKGWQSVTYGNGQFVAVANSGTGERVMTSSDGSSWSLQTTPADYNWYSVTYGNGLFVAVAYSGTGQRVMTSPNGTTWTLRDSAADEFWSSVTYGDGRFVAVSATGTGTRAMSSGGPCGDGLAYTTNQWLMVGVPCQPSTNTVAGTFGNSPTANFASGTYDVATTGWVMYERNVKTVPSSYYKMDSTTDPFDQAYGLWLKSGTAPVNGRATVYDGTPWPVSAQTDCQAASCAVLKVETVSGDNRYNLVNNPFPYPVDWSKVRVRVNGTVITPTAAQTAGYLSNQIWIWNGNAYETWSDTSNPIGNLKYFQSFWVNVLPGAFNQTVELLIPAEASTHSQVVPLDDRLYAALRAGAARLLDWLIPSATAAGSAADSLAPGRAPGREGGPHPVPGREVADPTLDLLVTQGIWSQDLEPEAALMAAHETARAEGREWWVRLKLDQPATGFYDHTNTLGQQLNAQNGYDPADLVEMAPFAAPYLTLDFPHPESGRSRRALCQRLSLSPAAQPAREARVWSAGGRLDLRNPCRPAGRRGGAELGGSARDPRPLDPHRPCHRTDHQAHRQALSPGLPPDLDQRHPQPRLALPGHWRQALNRSAPTVRGGHTLDGRRCGPP